MLKFLDKALASTFYLLFFFLPLILLPLTSELFEFNKMVFVYLTAVIATFLWLSKMILTKKFYFRRTMLDIPLVLFAVGQSIATVTSIDRTTSLFGYYSRFNGGLLSTLAYLSLYFVFVANLTAQQTKKSITLLLGSFVLVSAYGILEHFGIDKNLWVQDVQNRVFSTLGQPNWLAAALAAILPLTWALSLTTRKNRSRLWIIISAVFFLTLLYTKSRSGFLGFLVADGLFWLVIFSTHRAEFKNIVKKFAVINASFLLFGFISGTPWTPAAILFQPAGITPPEIQTDGPALEVGGTASSEIRKIVWKGASDIFRANPLVGTGVETFAYSYFLYRPIEHNLVSEWDFLYNKAHNEYLNYAANTGLVGLISYLILIGFALGVFYQRLKTQPAGQNQKPIFAAALLAGYVNILITNFFGFSVVVVSLLFFLFPALAITLSGKSLTDQKPLNFNHITLLQKVGLATVCVFTLIVLYLIGKYWYADVLYAQGKNLNKTQNYLAARKYLVKATKLTIQQPLYWDELSQSSAGLALSYYQTKDLAGAKLEAETAITQSEFALSLSPRNLNLRKNNAALFIKLASLDPKLLIKAEELILTTINFAPSDAKLYYNLGLVQLRRDKKTEAVQSLQKAITLKPNYRDARIALAIVYNQQGLKNAAKSQLEYVLNNINPQDELARQQLQEI